MDGPPDEKLADFEYEAVVLAEKHPDHFGYPHLDREKGVVVLRPASSVGKDLTAVLQDSAKKQNAPTTVEPVELTYQQLETLRNAIIDNEALPDRDLIGAYEGDYAKNRVVVTVSKVSDRFFQALADTFGTEVIAVRVDPDSVDPNIGTEGRNNDTSPFWGGARIGTDDPSTCTSGFPWESGSSTHMLTAGHCGPYGANVWTSPQTQTMGVIDNETRENWSRISGSVLLPGQSTYRGDLALIRIYSGKSSGTAVYSGDPGTSDFRTVAEIWHRWPVAGDTYCTSGATTGQICGWVVKAGPYDQPYTKDGPNVVARRIYRGEKTGACTDGGDSGAPLYTHRPDGKVAAKGIHSGGAGATNPCKEYFTNIRDAAYGAFPGGLRLG